MRLFSSRISQVIFLCINLGTLASNASAQSVSSYNYTCSPTSSSITECCDPTVTYCNSSTTTPFASSGASGYIPVYIGTTTNLVVTCGPGRGIGQSSTTWSFGGTAHTTNCRLVGASNTQLTFSCNIPAPYTEAYAWINYVSCYN